MTPSALIRQALRYKRYWGKEGGITAVEASRSYRSIS